MTSSHFLAFETFVCSKLGYHYLKSNVYKFAELPVNGSTPLHLVSSV